MQQTVFASNLCREQVTATATHGAGAFAASSLPTLCPLGSLEMSGSQCDCVPRNAVVEGFGGGGGGNYPPNLGIPPS